MSNPTDVHCTNKLQNMTPTMEIVTDSKVSNPIIYTMEVMHNGPEDTHTYQVSESTPTMTELAQGGHQFTILGLPILHLAMTQRDN